MTKKGKGGNQEKKKKEEKKPEGLVGLASAVLANKFGPEAQKIAMDMLNGDASFLSWWQRNAGESIVSTQNILKAAGLIGGYAVSEHLDIFKDSKVDNIAFLLSTIALGALLVIPQSSELGAHFHNFEADIFLLLQEVEDEEEKEKILRWIRGLSNRQEGRFAGITCGLLKTTEGKVALHKLLASERMRNAIKDLLGEDTPPTNFEESVKKAKEIVKKYWPQVKGSLVEADRQIAGKLHGLRLWLEGKGVK